MNFHVTWWDVYAATRHHYGRRGAPAPSEAFAGQTPAVRNNEREQSQNKDREWTCQNGVRQTEQMPRNAGGKTIEAQPSGSQSPRAREDAPVVEADRTPGTKGSERATGTDTRQTEEPEGQQSMPHPGAMPRTTGGPEPPLNNGLSLRRCGRLPMRSRARPLLLARCCSCVEKKETARRSGSAPKL